MLKHSPHPAKDNASAFLHQAETGYITMITPFGLVCNIIRVVRGLWKGHKNFGDVYSSFCSC